MNGFKTALGEVLRLERRKQEASSVDEVEQIAAEIYLLRQSSFTACIVYTLLDVNERFPLLLPLIVIALVAKTFF